MRLESRALFGDLPALRQAEDLIAAAVGEDRFVPADELVQAAATRDQIVAGSQVQVIRIAQQDLGAGRLEISVRGAFDGALSPDRHECRCGHIAVWGRHHPAPGCAVAVGDTKVERVV